MSIKTFGRDTSGSIPESTYIKEDFLIAFCDLEKIETVLDSASENLNLDFVRDQLVNIENVYNQNVEYINKQTQRVTVLEFQTEEEFSRGRYARSSSEIREEYSIAKFRHEYDAREKCCELFQLKQLGFTCKPLTDKISRCIVKLEKLGVQVPPCELLQPNLMLALFAPQLRSAETAKTPVEKVNSTPISNTPTIEIVEEKTTTPVVVETEPKTMSNDPQITITVTTDLPSEYTFGICCAPEWDQAPIAFVKGEQGWSGQLPLCKNWKCVALQNGQVVKWEGYFGDRYCDAETKPFNLHVSI